MKLKKATIYQGSFPHILGDDHPEEILNFEDMVQGEEFWGERINTVAAIVGNNGSGKSSILNGIKNSRIEIDFKRINGMHSGNNLVIFYSSFLDDSFKSYSGGVNSIDLSKFYQIEIDTEGENVNFATTYNIHQSKQTQRIINLLRNDTDRCIITEDLNLPRFTRVKIKAVGRLITSRNTPMSFWKFFKEYTNIRDRERQARYEAYPNDSGEEIEHKKFEVRIRFLSCIIDMIHDVLESNDGYLLSSGVIVDQNFSSFSNLLSAFNYFINNAIIEFDNRTITFPVEEINNLVSVIFDNIPDEIENTAEIIVGFDITSDIIDALNKFLLAFPKDFNFRNGSLITFTPEESLSSGELSMYNLFSTLHDFNYHIKNQTEVYYISNQYESIEPKNLLFLFDEADLDFHPLWKKRFIDVITKALPRIFPNSTMSIVFTTHDPLTLSDIPSSNVFYLEKINNVSKLTKGKLKTFAANINDLLSESFFVEDGLIGDFSKDKINEIIKWIRTNRDFDKRGPEYGKSKKKYTQWIGHIDEPITKIKLAEMMGELEDDSLELRNRMIDEEIERLTKLKGRE